MLTGAKFARGTITTDGKKLQFTIYSGNATVAHLKKSFKSAFDGKALSGLKRLLRSARIATPSSEVIVEVEEDAPLISDETLSETEQAEMERLIEEQGPLVEQLSSLADVLRSDGDPELLLIAEGGLSGVLAPHHDALSAALKADTIARSPKGLTAVKQSASLLATHLESAPTARVVDDNPFGVAVGLRGPLHATLVRLSEAANTLAGGGR